MRKIVFVLVLAVLPLISLSSRAVAGDFNLASIQENGQMAIADPVNDAKDDRLVKLQDQIDKLTKMLTASDVSKARATAARQNTAPALSISKALGQTNGQCANGQCGR